MEQSDSYQLILGRYRKFVRDRIYLFLQGFGDTAITTKWTVPDYTQRDLERSEFDGWSVKFTSPTSFQLSRL